MKLAPPLAAVLLCGFVALAPVRAQFSWSPTAASSVFEADANWSLGVAPTAGANLFFSSSAVSDLVLAANFNARSLAFNGSYPAYTFSTGSAATLGVGSGGLAVGSGGGVTFTPGLGVVLIASQTWNLAGNLTVAGTVSGSGSSLTKSGAGTLTLTGTSTYSGTTTINGGTLQIGAGGTTGNLGASSVTNHATLRFDRTNTHTVANAIGGSGNLVQAGTGTTVLTGANTYSGATTVSAGTLQIGAGGTTGNLGAGSVTNNATLRFNRSDAFTIANAIDGTGQLVKSGSGTLTLAGANSYIGNTNVSAGTLLINGNQSAATGAISVASGAALGGTGTSGGAVSVLDGGTVAAPSSGALTVGGLSLAAASRADFTVGAPSSTRILQVNGALTLDGLYNLADAGGLAPGTYRLIDYTGALTNNTLQFGSAPVNPGDLSLSTAVANQVNLVFANAVADYWIGGAGTWSAAGGATSWERFDGTGDGAWQSRIATFRGTAGTVTVDNGPGAVNFTGAQFVTSGYTVAGGTLTTATAETLLQVGNGEMSGAGHTATISAVITGSGGIQKTGRGTLTLTGANTYSGATTVSAGTLQIGAGGTTGNLGAGSVTNNATLRLDRSNTHTVANAIGGSGNLVQAGTGTTVLTGANTYSGDTSINAGTLKLGAAGVLPTGVGKGDVTVNSAGTLDLNGLSHTINGLSGGGTVTSGAGGALTFGVGSDGSGSTFSGSIQDGSGTLSLLKAGNGIINLSGTNTYSGTTTINGGTLQIGAGGTSGSIGSGNITNNANLRFNRSNTLTVASAIGGSGNLVQAGTGTTVLTAASSYSGTTTVTAGTLRVGVANALPTTTSLSLASGTLLDVDFNQTVAGFFGASGAGAAIDVAGGTIFSVALPTAATATSFAGAVNGVGTFAVSGPGDNTVTLNGAVAGTVATTVGSGTTLVIGTGGSLSGSVVISGMLTFTIPGNQTLSGVLSGTGGLTVSAGAVTLGANNTFSGPATVTGGQLLVAGTNTGGGSVTVGAGGIFGGAGSFNGPLVVNSGGALAPGASPGVLNVGPTTFAGGAAFNFEINNSAGTAGSEWDLLSISGALTITATAINPFVINLASLTLSNTPGLLTGFNPNNSYSWRFVQTTDAIAGFSSGAFQSNAGAFQNSLNGGSFFVSNVGSDLYLNFTPVPEPSTYALLALGLGAYAFLARRRGIRSGVRQEPER